MIPFFRRIRSAGTAPRVPIAALAGVILLLSQPGRAQDIAPTPTAEDSVTEEESARYRNSIAGEFTPAKGFDIIKTRRASLNISAYGLFRYVNQLPGEQTFTDHLGRVRPVKARNDINWHRTMIWLTGFLGVPEFRYNITAWSLGSTQQTLLFGNLMYVVGRPLIVGCGMGPNLTSRSMSGSWPFWAGSDRQMSEELMRGGFSSAFFIKGEPIARVNYTASVNTNLSQLGITATNDSRDLAYSATVTWLPTTGEFGPRGGMGDLEHHEELATRFGSSVAHAREDRGAPVGQPNNETQIRLSDGVYLFEAGALADTVTVIKADYDYASFDAGFKYRGFSFQGEYYLRRLSNFQATGPVPFSSITDHGIMLQAMHMVVGRKLGLYVTGGYILDDFDRKPWELSGGASYYPFGDRSLRLNLHLIRIDKSPTGSNFGYYTAGQSGTTISLGADILL